MPTKKKQYGSASAQDLYHLFIKSGVFDQSDQYPWWELVDDEDDAPDVGDEWYVVVDIGTDEVERRRIDAARLWVAILACASDQVTSVEHSTMMGCRTLALGLELESVVLDHADADAVMQVALCGRVEWTVPKTPER